MFVGGISLPPISMGPLFVPVHSISAATLSSPTTRAVCLEFMSGNALRHELKYLRAASLSRIGSGWVQSYQTKSSANRATHAFASPVSQAAIPWSSSRSMSCLDMPPTS